MEALLAAAQPLLAPAFAIGGGAVTWLELAACALSLWMVACNFRVDPLAWPLAIAASLLYGLLFADARLYGEASLQLVFVAVALWGWRQWLAGRGDDGRRLQVRALPAGRRWQPLAAMALLWPALGLLLDRATDSDLPWFDALPTAGSLVGQWLLGRKYVENWPAWLAVNVVSVALFAHKGLWLTTALYALFAVLSVVGWRHWRRLCAVEAMR